MTISNISEECIKKLCAGQVITTLANCVKELVENSLDAGSKNVEIIFRNSGIDSISVSDDGAGILKEDFPFLGQKHFTSKLKDFDDLSTIQSYGFRGEALFSIATVSEACTVISKNAQSNEDLGMKVEWRNGKSHMTGAPRKVGTSIIVDNLFSRYPVRHKEFQRGIKTQFSDAVEILTGYALGNPKVRFVCFNIPKSSGSRLLIFQSGGNGSLLEAYKDMFTSVKIKSFLPFEFEHPIGPYKRCYGCISKEMPASKGSFIFFINRPCDYKKITKAITDLYRKQFDPKGNLFIILHIIDATDALDVNVTPDKRKIFIRNEKELLEYLLENIVKYLHKLSGISATRSLLPSPISQKTISFIKTNEQVSSPITGNSHVNEHFISNQNKMLPFQESRTENIPVKRQVELTDYAQLLENDFHSRGLLNFQSKDGTLRDNQNVKLPFKSTEPLQFTNQKLNTLPTVNISGLDNKKLTSHNCDEPTKTCDCAAGKPNCSSKNCPVSQNDTTRSIEEPSYLCKSDLANMRVIGQFNLGFIVTLLQRDNKKELYIVDQHAADEKYNFEKMFSCFNPTIQKLIHPMLIDLSASEEAFIQDNMEEFKKCGFYLSFDDENQPGNRVSLEAAAVIDGLHFDLNGNCLCLLFG